MGTRSPCALSALAFISQLAITNGDARAQEVSSSSAEKVCRDKIAAQGFRNAKHVGPVEALHGVSIHRSTGGNLNTGPEIVPESNVRVWRARLQGTNFIGSLVDYYAMCFFETRGSSYRFVQICTTKGLTSTFHNDCDLRWIVTDFWYAKVQKDRKGSP